MYENLEKQFGKDNPSVLAHKAMLQSLDPDTGPYFDAGRNSAGGYEVSTGLGRAKEDGIGVDVAFGGGKAIAWDEDGGTQYGIKGDGGYLRAKAGDDGSPVQGGFDFFTAGAEASAGENGITAQYGANVASGEVTVGDLDKENDHDTQERVGIGLGPGVGVRVHSGDPDGDDFPNIGFGIDGPISFDVTTEDPLRYLASKAWLPVPFLPHVIDLIPGGNWTGHVTDEVMGYGPLRPHIQQAVKNIIPLGQDSAATQAAAPQMMPPSPEDQSLEFMTQMHEMMAAQRQ
jgi:hypothetical protein